jgi:hypothetical protein
MENVLKRSLLFLSVAVGITLSIQSCSDTYDEAFYNRVAIIDSTTFYTLKITSTVTRSGSGSFSSWSYDDINMYLVKYSIEKKKPLQETFLQKGLSRTDNKKILYREPWVAYGCRASEQELWVYNTQTKEHIKVANGLDPYLLFISTKGNFVGYEKDKNYVYEIGKKQVFVTFEKAVKPFYYDEERNEIHVIILSKSRSNNVLAIYDVNKGILRDSIQTAYIVDEIVDRGNRIAMSRPGTMGHVLTLIDSVRLETPIGYAITFTRYDFSAADFYSIKPFVVRTIPATGIYYEDPNSELSINILK